MSWIQSLFKAILPRRWFEAMEAESRMWIMTCPCGHETSVWDAGGIRYKAAGKPIRLALCPHCGLTMHRLSYRIVDQITENEQPGS